ncbi:alcohol dehydrogenase catalytic domain-containing protein [candidate division KSB1 bacterium]|nr:alcohol dehydrogenase catalytic domain-containing protein [candidate division KSB1 bacterium]
MKTIVLTGIRNMELQDKPAPKVQDIHDVLLKIDAVGVCGSDMHYYTTGRIGDQIVKYPFTVGHECVATVHEVGSSVSNIKPGDRVAVEPAVSCGECDQCKHGRFHTCYHLQFLGCPGQLEGCLSEYIVMPEKNCFPIKATMSLERSVLVEPVSIACYALRLAGNLTGKTVGILGTGPIGLSVLLSAHGLDTGKIYATDKINSRLEFAKNLGASWTGNPDEVDIAQAVHDQEQYLLDVVFECCGQQEALDQALDILKPGGMLLIVGIPEVDRISFDISKIRRKEITVRNVRRQNECVEQAMQIVAEHPFPIEKMVTHAFTLEKTRDAFEIVAGYQDGVIKAMIQVNAD